MKTIIPFVVFLSLIANLAIGQVKFHVIKLNVDSLAVLIPSKEGSDKIDALNQLSNAICRKNLDSSFILAKQAIDLSEKLDFKKGLADGYFNIGNVYFLKDSLQPTISNYLKALHIYEDLEPSEEFWHLLNQIGYIKYYTGRTDSESYKEYDKLSTKVAAKLGKKTDDYSMNYGLGFFSARLDSSLYYFNRALAAIDTGVDRNETATVYCMIGRKYHYESNDILDTAKLMAHQWFLKALEVPDIADDVKSLIYIEIVRTYLQTNTKKSYASALKYLHKAKNLTDNWIGNDNPAYKVYQLYGRASFEQGDYKKAITHYKQAIVLSEERLSKFSVNDYREPILAYDDKYMIRITKYNSYNGLFDSYWQLGEHQQALDYYKLSKKAEDEIFLEKNRNMITMMEAVSKDEKNKSQMEVLARDNKLKALAIRQSRTLNFGIAAIFVVLLLVGLLLWRQNKLKNESRNKILEQKYLHDLELKHLEAEKLKELDHLKSRFFANISHEFRTPLTLVLGPVDKVLSRTKDNDDKEELSIAKKYAGKLQTLINNLLAISKLESGKLQLHATETDLIKLLRSYLQSFESLAEQKNITLEFTSVDKEIKAYIDQEKFEQVLNNLLSNAFKFTDEGGVIEVAVSSLQSAVDSQQSAVCDLPEGEVGSLQTGDTEQSADQRQDAEDRRLVTEDLDGPWVCIKISDNGRGISPEHIHHIFDRFYQIEHKDNSFYEGTGIGLALTKELVELHHGTIKVESQTGKGSTFFLTLPLGKDHLKPEEIEVEKPQVVTSLDSIPISMSSKGETVTETNHEQPILLIVEDNADMRAYIREHFENEYRIIEAVDGADGFTESIKHIPDIIISDVMMPNMNGNEFCTKIKLDERTSHIPVILLTARVSKEYRIEGLETGADDFISKPFDGKELKVRVKNLIEQRKNIRAYLERKIQKSSIAHHIDFKDSGITSMDEQFLQKVIETVRQHHNDPQFNTIDLGKAVGLGKIQLNRKIKALTGETTVGFIRTYRLNRASELIKNKSATVAEIAYDVGFSSPSYFTECFRLHFGQLPSEFSGNQ